jgi:hypothetical protein
MNWEGNVEKGRKSKRDMGVWRAWQMESNSGKLLDSGCS